MNIVLIGMRGSGKSTIGKILAKKLYKQLVDIDELIEKEIGEKIVDHVAKNGWIKFRGCESEIISSVSNKKNSVISCGGGIVEMSENIKNLKHNGFIIYLSASIDTLYDRIGEDTNRPLLSNANSMKTDLENMLKKRKEIYEKAADLIISVDNKTVIQISEEIIAALNK